MRNPALGKARENSETSDGLAANTPAQNRSEPQSAKTLSNKILTTQSRSRSTKKNATQNNQPKVE
jgi:hypothetical protein